MPIISLRNEAARRNSASIDNKNRDRRLLSHPGRGNGARIAAHSIGKGILRCDRLTPMTWWTVAVFIVTLIAAAILWAKETVRELRIRALAKAIGFAYAGKRLPEALSLYGTPFNPITSILTSNVIDGQRDGIRVIAFDCEVVQKTDSWSRTVIAARTSANVFGDAAFSPDRKVVDSGGWKILYHPQSIGSAKSRGLMSVAELKLHPSAIGAEQH